MTQKTILNETHRALGAKMVDFGGWDMPISYGSQIEEHHAVRRDAGMFDVSHMTVVDLHGARTREFLRHLLANNIDKLKAPGKALYSCMLNAEGGVIDDLIVYFLADDFFRVVVNASTRDKDLAWIGTQATPFGVKVAERPELAMIAVQGPNARDKVLGLLAPEARAKAAKVGKFAAVEVDGPDGAGLFVARTGYTGEDGFELYCRDRDTADIWQALTAAGAKPIGLGARDTLRLEMGYALYGNDIDDTITPLEAGLGWIVKLDKGAPFMGDRALREQKARGVTRKLVGFRLDGRGIPRHGYPVHLEGREVDVVRSGTMSPSLGEPIGTTYLPADAAKVGTRFEVEIRGERVPAEVVKRPFWTEGSARKGR